MTNSSEQPESLGNEVTRTGDSSRPDHSGQPGDTVASFGELHTGGETRSSMSDLGDLEQAADGPHELVDLESRYEILGTLGRGGMGEVVRAMDQRLQREVAIKRMREEFGSSRQAMRRFLTEAVSIAALNHYNVVQIYDYGHTAEGPFLVMELVEGPTLAERLHDGPLPLDESVELTRQLCEGLQAAHDRGLVHRDIKPANILVTADGTPKLTDFGLAREVADTGLTRTGAVLGTLDYMAPEQKEDASQVDARSDQWSLAATFYQMVTGKVPRLIRLNDLPAALQPVVEQALAENPAERFASVRDFAQAVQQAVTADDVPLADRAGLQEGQCPGCGTVNEVARKFCRGCGVSLLEDCPDCGAAEKVWERFCGDCGVDIPQAIESRMETARELQAEVQSLRSGYRHSEALEKLTPMLEAGLPALSEYRAWAETTREQLTHELDELQGQREQLLQAAREQSAQGNISAARMYLARIPEHLQDHATWQFEEELTAADAEVKRLAREIRDATRAKRYRGLAPKVERFLELQPHDERARSLLQKLRDRWPAEPEEPVSTISDVSVGSAGGSPKNSRRPNSPMEVGVGVGIAVVLLALVVWVGSSGPEPVESASVASGPEQPRHSPAALPTVSNTQWPDLFDSTDRPRTAGEAQAAQRAWATALGTEVVDGNSIGMKLTLIPPGEFLMGSPDSDRNAGDDEQPRHGVRITRPYYLQTTEVTQSQWKAVMRTEPWKRVSNFREGDDNVATYVSWNDAEEFCRKLSLKEGVTYRLPTEAEWEYACRAGTTTRYHFGDSEDRLGEFAWFEDNADDAGEDYAHEVGRKQPNAWGLFDMHGNVLEWCRDGYDKDCYRQFASKTAVDPQGPSSVVSGRVLRGGSWANSAGVCRAARRVSFPPGNWSGHGGFRVVWELPRESSQPSPADQKTPNHQQTERNPIPSLPTEAPPLFDSTAASSASGAKPAQQAWAAALGIEVVEQNSIGMQLTLIPPGEFLMGSGTSATELASVFGTKAEYFRHEFPRHRVRITTPFYMGIHEVTQAQWKAVMSTEPWKGNNDVREGDDFAATYISWYDAQEFYWKLSTKEGVTYRLPTEAEWEYACRAGAIARYHFGDATNQLGDFAWFRSNTKDVDEKFAHQVGRKKPNAFGLFDMHGNVYEWCRDGYGEDYYQHFASKIAVDPQGPSSGFSTPVFRGGGWFASPRYCRAAFRSRAPLSHRSAGQGFRVVRELPGE